MFEKSKRESKIMLKYSVVIFAKKSE